MLLLGLEPGAVTVSDVMPPSGPVHDSLVVTPYMTFQDLKARLTVTYLYKIAKRKQQPPTTLTRTEAG